MSPETRALIRQKVDEYMDLQERFAITMAQQRAATFAALSSLNELTRQRQTLRDLDKNAAPSAPCQAGHKYSVIPAFISPRNHAKQDNHAGCGRQVLGGDAWGQTASPKQPVWLKSANP